MISAPTPGKVKVHKICKTNTTSDNNVYTEMFLASTINLQLCNQLLTLPGPLTMQALKFILAAGGAKLFV